MKASDIVTDFDASTKRLKEALNRFSEEQFNVVPFDESWTPGQVAEHLSMSEAGIPEVLLGPVKETKRAIYEKEAELGGIFLDFSTKLKAPDFIIPTSEPKEKKELINKLVDNREVVRQLIEELDLSKTCTSFPFPEVGELTRLEWIYFMIVHSKRHVNQLNNIYQCMKVFHNIK